LIIIDIFPLLFLAIAESFTHNKSISVKIIG
jgi:hypothetical protein